MKELHPSDFTTQESHTFEPTDIFFIHDASRLSPSIYGHRLDQQLQPINSSLSIKDASSAVVNTPPTYTITRPSILSRSFECKDSTGAARAHMTSTITALGKWKLDLPPESSSHVVEMRSTGMASRTDVFVRESIPYFWDVSKADASAWTLYKTLARNRYPVAEFRGKSARSVVGILDFGRG